MDNTIKQQLLEAGVTEEQIDTHESDLYVLKNDISMAWLESYEFKASVTTFRSQIDNQIWYDIPFGYANEYYAKRKQGLN